MKEINIPKFVYNQYSDLYHGNIGEGYKYFCPTCGNRVFNNSNLRCTNCNQLLKWG